MLSSNKNSEAQQCANTNWASMSVTTCKETNMNSLAKSEYNFHGVDLVPVSSQQGVWFTSADLASALEYSNSRAVTMIFNKYADEFTAGMTQVLEVSTSGNYRKKVRVFSLRGAHLIAMFARTPVAKEFRRWVLDILDREVVTGNISPTFDFEMHAKNALVAEEHFKYVYMVWKESIRPALRCTGSPLAVSLEDRFKAISAITFGLSCALSKQEKNWGIH